MNLLLSSDALPDASLELLLQACRRRALSGLELTLDTGQGHGVDERTCPVHQQDGGRCVPQDVTEVAWLRLPQQTSLTMLTIWSGAAHQTGAGLLLGAPVADPPPAPKLALVHDTDPAAAREAAAWARQHDAGTCWNVTPGLLENDVVDQVLEATMPTLSHVRLPGSGPEAEAPGSVGTGSLLTQLSLRGFSGTVSLVPSPGADLNVWARWLLNKRGWGCGTAAQKAAQKQARREAALAS